MYKFFVTLLLITIFLSASTTIFAKDLIQGTRLITPFVVDQGDQKLSGYSIEIIDRINKSLGNTIKETKISPNVADLLSKVQSKEVDYGIAAISETSARENNVDFSVPIYESGLQLMGHKQVTNLDSMDVINYLLEPTKLLIIFGIIAFLFFIANTIYFIERKNPASIIYKYQGNYILGVIESLIFSLKTLLALGNNRKGLGTRITSILVFSILIIAIAILIFNISLDLQQKKITTLYNKLEDAKGKEIITVTTSTAETYLKNNGYIYKSYPNINEAMFDFDKDQNSIVFYDAPVLYSKTLHSDKFELIGPKLNTEYYAIAFPLGSDLRKPFNEELLKLYENGVIKNLKINYFGRE